MTEMHKKYYAKRGEILVKNLKNRHFDAWYCDTKEDALAKVLELIPEGAKIGWGGVLSAQQIVSAVDFSTFDQFQQQLQQLSDSFDQPQE